MRDIKWWWLPTITALLLSFFLETRIFLHPDMMYLLYASEKMLAGGTYTHDFLETNPPMVFYIYAPVVLAAKISGINILYLFRFFIVSLCGITLLLCGYFIHQLKLDQTLKFVLFYSSLLVLVFFPVHEFGQRDHILMLATFPYFFLMLLRFEGKPINPILACIIGLYAALGIGMKPFFLAVPFFTELYYAYKQKYLLALFRPETLMIALTLCIYMTLILLAYPEYFSVILPLVSHFYFIGIASPWEDYFTNPYVLFSIGPLAFYLIARMLKFPDQHPIITTVLFFAIMGYVTAFTIPHTIFYYQILPAFGMAFVFFTFYFTQIVRIAKTQSGFLNLGLVIFPLTVLCFPIYTIIYTAFVVYESRFDPAVQEIFMFFNASRDSSYLYLSGSNDCMLFNYYSKANYVGRYPFFWWENGLEKASRTPQVERDKSYLVNFLAKNLQEEKPHFILMDTMVPSAKKLRRMDYPDEFANFASFRHAWAYYHYLTTFGRLKVYERQP